MFSNNSYSRVLIFSQTFNNFSGGGITLSNLFIGWPKEKLAVLTYNFMLSGVSSEICDTYYQLGHKEIQWKFPFSLLKQKYKSGLYDFVKPSSNECYVSDRKKRKWLSANGLNRLVEWLGLDHVLSSISISDCLNSWLSEYKPELLYFQISNWESINFASKLIQHLAIPSVIHMMDDWPTILADKSIFSKFLTKRINKDLQHLFDKIDLHLGICDEMSKEYKKRYKNDFYSFHNTIDPDKWIPFSRKDVSIKEGTKIILFSGRIGKGIEQSLFELADAVDILRLEGIEISLQIQSPRSEHSIMEQIRRYRSVVVNSPVEYDSLPELYAKADILVITNDFSREGIRFLKYSMPTKAPEYMISGTPVLVYASSETALYKLFYNNKCGHCVSTHNISEIASAIKLLLNDIRYREILSKNAVTYAIENFDSKNIRLRFQSILRKTAGENLT